MALIIEDGSQIPNANSYVTDAEYVAYAAAQNLSIGGDTAAREIELLRAMTFIESHRSVFKGLRVSKDQPLQWPRSAVWIDSFPVNADEIPQDLKNAQIESGVAENAIELLKTEDNQNVKRQKVDVIEVEFFSGGSWTTARTERVDVFLTQLLKTSLGGFNVMVMRA